MKPYSSNDKLIKSWLQLEQALSSTPLPSLPSSFPLEQLKSPSDLFKSGGYNDLFKKVGYTSETLQNNTSPDFFKNVAQSAKNNTNPAYQSKRPISINPKTPLVSTISSIRNLLSAKAHSRPHYRPGTANPRLMMGDPKELLSNININDLQKLKKEMESIHSLKIDEILDIYSAKCQDNKVEYIPSQALKFISKFKNKAGGARLFLEELGLGGTSAKVINRILMQNNYFTNLLFSKNLFGDVGTIILADAVRTNMNIVHIDLSSNDVGPEGAQALFAALLENCSVVSINLSSKEGLNRNRLGVRGVEPLEWVLKKNKILQFLKLSSTSIGLVGLECILAGLEENESLIELDISHNELGPEGCSLLSNTINHTCLRELILASNRLGDDGLDKLVGIFRPGSKSNILEKLDLSNNGITSMGVAKLFETLHKNVYLKKLILSQNRFSGRGFHNITYYLMENNVIMHLDFRECDIQSEGGEAIANGLAKNKSLQYLILSNNYIQNEGCILLAGALSENKSIKYLDLSKCRLKDEGGISIAQVIKNHPTIRYLFLRENNLHDETGALLTDAVQANKHIKMIIFDRNPISYKYTLEIKKILQTNLSNRKLKRVPTYFQKMADLQTYELQKSTVNEESRSLNLLERKYKEELDKEKSTYQKQKEEELKKNELVETNLNHWVNEFKNNEASRETYEKNIKGSIIDLERKIEETENNIGKENQDIYRLEMDVRNLKEKQQIKRSRAENNIQELRKQLGEMSKKATLVNAGYKSFQTQVNNLKNKMNGLGDELENKEENEKLKLRLQSRKSIKEEVGGGNELKEVKVNVEKKPKKVGGKKKKKMK